MDSLRCLILGGAGFLGKNLCKTLYNNRYKVSVYNHPSKKLNILKSLLPDVDIIQGDFSQENDFMFLKDFDIVFHLISTTNPSNKNMLYDFESNVLPTIRFFDACVREKIRRIIYFSSGGTVYGIPQVIPINESHRTDPISAYGIQKLSIEKCLEYYGRTYQLPYTILRISNPYGPGQDPLANQGVIAVFLAKAIMNQTLEIWGDGNSVRDYIFVDDVMNACLKAIAYQGKYNIFNIGSGIGHSVKDIVFFIERILGKELQINYMDARMQDVPANTLDVQLAKKELNWYAQRKVYDGICDMVHAWDNEKKGFIIH